MAGKRKKDPAETAEAAGSAAEGADSTAEAADSAAETAEAAKKTVRKKRAAAKDGAPPEQPPEAAETAETQECPAQEPRQAASGPPPSKNELIGRYLQIFEQCTQEAPKAFDAKGALSALDQVSKALGYDAPERRQDAEPA